MGIFKRIRKLEQEIDKIRHESNLKSQQDKHDDSKKERDYEEIKNKVEEYNATAKKYPSRTIPTYVGSHDAQEQREACIKDGYELAHKGCTKEIWIKRDRPT